MTAETTHPYTQRVTPGTAAPDLLFFDPQVLERYASDPRYQFSCSDFSGQIYSKDNAVAGELSDEDRCAIQVFGFAHDSGLKRSVCIMLAYLAGLPLRHQLHWQSYEITGEYTPHPGFAKPAFLGERPDGMSVFTAIAHEIMFLNQLTQLAGRAPFFQLVPGGEDDFPEAFHFLSVPTQQRYYRFLMILDQHLSDNINRDFFADDIEWTITESRKSGEDVTRSKGTLEALDEWLSGRCQPNQTQADVLCLFRNIRAARTDYAHKPLSDKYDADLLDQQRALAEDVFSVLQSLRQLMSEVYPDTGFSVPEDVLSQKVWMY